MPDTQKRDTVSMYFVNAAIARLDPAARERVLEGAGIPSGLLGSESARVPASAFSALWLGVAREMDDEFFGLDCRGMKVGSFALICQAVSICENLEQATRRMLRGFSLFLQEVEGELLIEGDDAVLRINNRIQSEGARRFADETFLILTHGLMCWLIRQRLDPRMVSFAHPRPAHAVEYTTVYSQHLQFGAEATSLRFDARLLANPVVRNRSALQQFLRSAPQSVFLRYKNEDSWTAKLRRRLRSAAGSQAWPVFDELAIELDTTPTTLRRKLIAEGVSFQDIKDQLRSDLAIDRLCHTGLSMDDISAELGFHDASAFHRAFKRWNGLQPGEYRLRQRMASPSA